MEVMIREMVCTTVGAPNSLHYPYPYHIHSEQIEGKTMCEANSINLKASLDGLGISWFALFVNTNGGAANELLVDDAADG